MNRSRFLIFTILISQIVVSQVPAYYSSIDFGQSGEALKSDLTTLISGHTEFPYSSSSTDTWDILQQSDILSGDNVLLIYGYDDSDSNPITDRLRDKDDECSFSRCTFAFGISIVSGTIPKFLIYLIAFSTFGTISEIR